MTGAEEGNPSTYRRRVLVAVVGLTPQVVTEALYALAILREPAFVPTEIHIATTIEGRERTMLTLLEPASGALSRFSADYPQAEVSSALSEERVHVIQGSDGPALADIGTAEENTIAADFLINLIRTLTRDDAAALHVSIAGGRKTMGFFAGYALSLFGREQDRLSHVLVSEAFESHPEFFYPPPAPRVLFSRSDRPMRTDAARITLAEIPFVRLRHGLPSRLLDGRATYREAVKEAQRRFEPPALVIDLARKSATAGEQNLPLTPLLFAWLVWLAERCLALGPEDAAMHWSHADAHSYLAVCERVLTSSTPNISRARKALAAGVTKEYFEEKKSRYNKLVTAVLGRGAAPYLIVGYGRRPQTRFGLALPVSAIRIVAADTASTERGSG